MPAFHRRCRRGATLIESALVFFMFLTLVLGMFELGTAVLGLHLVTDASRQLARQASVHGALADDLGPWGPATVGPLAASSSNPACTAVQNYLAWIDPSTVTVLVEWPDGGNAVGMRVRVTLTGSHALILPQMWGWSAIPLQAVSTTIITH